VYSPLMSYCRFIEADVYVYMDVSGFLTCAVCSLLPEDGPTAFNASSTHEMITHLRDHKKAGNHVPNRVFTELWADDEKNFPNSSAQKEADRREALEELRRLTEEIRSADPETFDANEHWINNPLISPVSKVQMFEEWDARVRREELERVTRVAEQWISELRGHDGECNCTHEANVLQQFIEHEEFRSKSND